MCNLYSITTNRAAIIALLRVINRYHLRRNWWKMPATRYPQPSQEVALSSHFCVCSSVQPGTAKRVGAATPLLGRTMTC
jgi:hypothetical protein